MNALLLFWSCIYWISASQRLFYQSQCVFRHGARAPAVWIIPPYDQLFQDTFNANPADLTTEGIQQHKAFGSYLRTKYMSSGWFTGTYNFDAKLMAISTTNTRRTHQSAEALVSGLYNEPTDQFAQIFTVPLDDDILRVDSSCFNFNAEENFQESDSAQYAQTLFNKTANNELFPLMNGWSVLDTYNCSTLGAACYILLADQYDSISFHFGDMNDTNHTIDDGGVLDTLRKYKTSLEEMAQYDSYTPYTSDAQNIGFELFNEIVNHLDCSYINALESKPCINTNNQSFEQECDAGFCGIVLYSAHDSTLRSLAHQMGILEESNMFNMPPFASSICFDSYREPNGTQTVEMYYGHAVKSGDAVFGYEYVQKPLGEYTGGDILSCGSNVSCSLKDVLKYRESRVPNNDGCCTLDGNSKIYFDALSCDKYEFTNGEIAKLNGGYDVCGSYRDKCPSTACGDGLMYAPVLQKCVAMKTETEKTEARINVWEIIGIVFMIAFCVTLMVLVYVAYRIYSDDNQNTNYSTVPAGRTSNEHEIQTMTVDM